MMSVLSTCLFLFLETSSSLDDVFFMVCHSSFSSLFVLILFLFIVQAAAAAKREKPSSVETSHEYNRVASRVIVTFWRDHGE